MHRNVWLLAASAALVWILYSAGPTDTADDRQAGAADEAWSRRPVVKEERALLTSREAFSARRAAAPDHGRAGKRRSLAAVDPGLTESAPDFDPESACQTTFDEEGEDERWSWRRKSELAEHLATLRGAAGDPIAVESLECRTTLCRMRLRFASNQESSDFVSDLSAPVLNRATFFRLDPQSGAVVLYLARQGYGLPSPDGAS